MTTQTDHAPVTTEDLWRTFRHQLLHYVQRRVPADVDADDVLQDIFIRLHEGLGELRDEERLRSWIFSIAHRAVADAYRRRGRRPEMVSIDGEGHEHVDDKWLNGVLPEAPQGNAHEEVLSWLAPLVDQLPDAYAVAVRMADLEGHTQQAVADALGLSLSGAKSRIQRGRAMLGDLLQACCDIEFGPDGRALAYERRQAPATPCEGRC